MNQTTAAAPVQSLEPKSKIIKAITADPRTANYQTKLEQFSFNMDSDAAEESIELYTTASRGLDGDVLWDDGQKWLLVIADKNRYYSLFDEYVQLGSVYFNVATIGEDQTPCIEVLVQHGCGRKIIDYVYDKKTDSYIENIIYETDDRNESYTSIPAYK